MAADDLYRRKATITIDTIEIPCGLDGLDVAFEVEKDLTGKPNTAKVSVWNISDTNRAALSARAAKKTSGGKPQGVRVRIDAGYQDNVHRVYEGDLRHIYHERNEADVITHVETGDGEYYVARSKIFKAYAPGTPVADVIIDVARSIGVGDGNLLKAVVAASLTNYGTTFTQGTAVAGKAMRELNRLTKSVGLEWSIQDGTLQLVGSGKSLDGEAVLLRADTGMVGSPTVDQKGTVSVKTLMIPNMFPGRKVKLDAAELQGFYRIIKTKHSGDTFGTPWYVDCDCKKLA